MRNPLHYATTALAALLFLAGCNGKDGDTIIMNNPNGGSTPVTGRADEIATTVDESWSDGYRSINIPETEDLEEFKVFRSTDGSGLIAWTQGDDGNEHAYVAYFGADGALVNQVRLRGFGIGAGAYDDTVESMEVLWLADGDALVVFLAEEDTDPTVPADTSSQRVYVARFDASAATTPWNAENTVNFGFSEATPVDTNAVTTDDNDVRSIFVASNLIDGTQVWELDTDLDNGRVFGDQNDASANFAFVGWIHLDINGDQRIEGLFVDVRDADGDGDRMEFTSATPTAIVLPGLDGTEDVSDTVVTCGGDMLFTYVDSTATPADERLFLVRVDNSTNPATIDPPVEITRGTNINAAVSIGEIHAVIGDGHSMLNGQTGTWVIYTEENFEDGTVTNPDTDLVIAFVTTTGTLSIDEFDHNGPAAANANNVSANDVEVQICRGATRAFVYYQQTFDVTGGAVETDDSLFVRAIRLADAGTMANNVSEEETVNSVHDTDGNGDTDVVSYEIADRNAFFGPDANNSASYVAFVQEIDGDTDSRTMKGRLVSIADFTATSLEITLAAEDVIVADSDEGWDSSLEGTYDYVVLENNVANGRGIVIFVDNGNNVSDDTAVGSFDEPRPMIYASLLPNEHAIMTPLQLGSDSTPTLMPFPQFRSMSDDAIGLTALVTPVTPAVRDNQFNTDTSVPAMAHVIFEEFLSNDGSEEGATYRGRTFALGDASSVADRFTPPLTQLPHNVGDVNGTEFEDQGELDFFLVPSGNDLVCVFNTGAADDDGDDTGRFFVNTFNGSSWSVAAVLSNDQDGFLDPDFDSDDVFEQDGSSRDFGFVPGVQWIVDSDRRRLLVLLGSLDRERLRWLDRERGPSGSSHHRHRNAKLLIVSVAATSKRIRA